jgi:pimeloyl-ACP methyl ester carboxylesterase
VWWVDALQPKLVDGLRLAPDGNQDAQLEARILPSVPHYIYAPFLAAVHATDEFYPLSFAYDWRKLLTESAAAFRDLILNQYEVAGRTKVSIVAHSMGGMVLRCALLKFGAEMWPRMEVSASR